MLRKHPVVSGVVITACIAGFSLGVITYATDDDTPSTGQVAFAQGVSDLMVNELVAALFKQFDETTPQGVRL
jgi:putative exporter of polyketide antibiotics